MPKLSRAAAPSWKQPTSRPPYFLWGSPAGERSFPFARDLVARENSVPLSSHDIEKLREKAWRVRRLIINTTVWAGGGHLGGALSQTDILVALYFHYMNINPARPHWLERDRAVLSKGHGGVGYAPVLAERGYFGRELLEEFNHMGSPFGMHLDRLKVPGVDASTGSLGHGLALSVGLALASRHQKQSWRVYCVLGDGECNEGSVWESAMAAAHYKLGNLTAFVDRNGLCIDGPTEAVMRLEPLADKFRSFGWNLLTIDGHDFAQIGKAIETAQRVPDMPTMILAQTVKGKGVDFMENDAAWHYGGLDSTRAAAALTSIDRFYGKA
jgi:transketolase